MENLEERLQKSLNRKRIDLIIDSLKGESDSFSLLYSLIDSFDSKISWRAAWVCEKLCVSRPDYFIPLQDNMMDKVLNEDTCMGTRRQLLSIFNCLPIRSPLRVDFLNFCLDHCFDPAYPNAVQSLCLKLSFKMCRTHKDLLSEFKSILENTDLELFASSVKAVAKNTRKAIPKIKFID